MGFLFFSFRHITEDDAKILNEIDVFQNTLNVIWRYNKKNHKGTDNSLYQTEVSILSSHYVKSQKTKKSLTERL